MEALGHAEEQSPVPALAAPPMRVLILARDRQFKRMARLLFESRGSAVGTGSDPTAVTELAARHGSGVVVLDVSDAVTPSLRAAAALAALESPVGVVLVSANASRESVRLSVLPKWGPFEDLFGEVVRAHRSSLHTTRNEDVAL